MSALELMDARMDVCMRNPTQTLQPHQASRVASEEQQRTWTPRTLLHFADALLQAVATHLSGVSLSHSLYSCTLLHARPYEQLARGEEVPPVADDTGRVFPLLHQPLLSLLSRLALHVCLSCRAVVSRADVYEEEEWAMQSFNAVIDERGGGEALGKEASAMEQKMEGDIKAAKKRGSAGGGGGVEQAIGSTAAELQPLLSRLRLLHGLFLLFSQLSSSERGQKGDAGAAKALSRASGHCQAVLSSPLLQPASGYHAEQIDWLASPSCPFDPSLASSLILHAPPRSYPLLPLSSSLSLLHRLLLHTGLVLSSSSLRSLPALFSFTAAFSLQQPNIVARSLLLSRCVDDDEDVARSGVSMQQLISKAIEELSPSTAVYFHPQLQAALFHPPSASASSPSASPSTANGAAESVVAPSPELLSSLFHHLSQLVCGHLRLLLMDGTKLKAKLSAQLQLLAFLLQATENVDQWMQHLSLSVLRWPSTPSADGVEWRSLLFDGGFHAFACDVACQTLQLLAQRQFAAELLVERELSVVHWIMHRWSSTRSSNRHRAWRDPKLVPVLISQHLALLQRLLPTPSASSSSSSSPSPTAPLGAAGRKKAKALLASLSPSPPSTAEALLVDACSALSTAITALIQGWAQARWTPHSTAAQQPHPLILVPSFPSSQLPTYFHSRFAVLAPLHPTSLSLTTTLSGLTADFAALTLDAAMQLAEQALGRAKEAIQKLSALHKDHPALLSSAASALPSPPAAAAAAAQPSTPSVAAAAACVVDLSSWPLLSVDAAFVRSLLVVCVSNQVTALTWKKTTSTAATTQAPPSTFTAPTAPSPPFRLRFSFLVNPMFPVLTIEPTPRARLQREPSP